MVVLRSFVTISRSVSSKKSSPTRIRYVPPAQHDQRKTSTSNVQQQQDRRRLSSNDSYSGRKHSNNELQPGRKLSSNDSPNRSPNNSGRARKVSSVSKKLNDAIDLDDTSRKPRYIAKVSITKPVANSGGSPASNKKTINKNRWKRGMTIIKERKANLANDSEMKDIA